MSWIYYGNRNGNPIYCCNRRAGQVCARNGDHSSDLPVCRGKTGYSWSRGAFDAGLSQGIRMTDKRSGRERITSQGGSDRNRVAVNNVIHAIFTSIRTRNNRRS